MAGRVHLCRIRDSKHCVILYRRWRSVALRRVSTYTFSAVKPTCGVKIEKRFRGGLDGVEGRIAARGYSSCRYGRHHNIAASADHSPTDVTGHWLWIDLTGRHRCVERRLVRVVEQRVRYLKARTRNVSKLTRFSFWRATAVLKISTKCKCNENSETDDLRLDLD